MARSVAELLPRPFAELTLDDVKAIIASTGGEERETLWFERKAAISPNSLSKACAAFANTHGGLLVVGVADDDDTLAGIEPLAAEAQLWVKDTLRGLVLPMPPFRARWLEVGDGRGVLLVLVEESSTTPHLLLRSGAIYVRNPGSSDPVPIGDQRRLLDLTRRGEEAAASAVTGANTALEAQLHRNYGVLDHVEKLALVPTGVSAGFEERLFTSTTPDSLSRTLWGEWENKTSEHRQALWFQDLLGVERTVRPRLYTIYGDQAFGVIVGRRGDLTVYQGNVFERTPDHPDALRESMIRQRFLEMLHSAREVLAELGAHGDLRLADRLDVGERDVFFDVAPDGGARNIPRPLQVDRWTTFDDDAVADSIFAELRRAVGIAPPAPE